MNKILAVSIAVALAGGGIAAAVPATAAETCIITVSTPARTIEGADYTIKIKPSAACADEKLHYVYGEVKGTDGTMFSQWYWDNSRTGDTLTASAPWPDTWTNITDVPEGGVNVVFVHHKLITDPNAAVRLTNEQSGTTANLTAKVVNFYAENSGTSVPHWPVELQRKHGKKWQNLKSGYTNSKGVAHFRQVVPIGVQQYRVSYQGNHFGADSNVVLVRRHP